MHILTGVVHCEALPGRLKCGRHVTANMRLMSQARLRTMFASSAPLLIAVRDQAHGLWL